MTAGADASSAQVSMSIGEVLTQLRSDYADITISKIRFLEDEGLVKPGRTAAGYRRFSRDDVARLRLVLSAQRDQYLPLRVIKEHLEALDRGGQAPEPDGPPRAPGPFAVDAMPSADDFRPAVSELRLSRAQLCEASGLGEDQLEQLVQYGLLGPRPGATHFDGDALVVARTVAQMARFGIAARHLRPFKAAADREVGLLEQVVTPLVRQRNAEARARAEEVVRELAALSVTLHSTLVRQGLAPGLRH